VSTDDVKVAGEATDPQEEKALTESSVPVKPMEAPAPAAPKTAAPIQVPAAAAPAAAGGEESFTFTMTRSTMQQPWGVDLTSDSEKSLTILAIHPTGALGASNEKAKTPLKPGDVIIKIGTGTTKTEMVDALGTGTSLYAEVVRVTKFDAVMSKQSPTEGLFMDVTEHKGKLLIEKISPKPSAITRYNSKNPKKPLIEGDMIVAVDGKEAVKDMVAVMKTNEKFTLSVVRSGNA
jgi:hypothetical protein